MTIFNQTIHKFVLGAALLTVGSWLDQAEAKNLSVTITDTQGRPMSGFLAGATREVLRIAANEQGQGITEVKVDQVDNITFNESPDGWSEALKQFQAQDFSGAEVGFTKLARELGNIALVPDEYGALARYYQLECLKRNGKLPQLATALGELRSSPIALGEYYREQLVRLRPWGLAGKGDWDGVLAYVAEQQEEREDAPRPRFKAELPRSEIVELSYLAGLAQLGRGENEAGLENLYRALTLNDGNDLILSGMAINKALAALDAMLKESESDELKREAYSIAVFYRDAIGKGTIDPTYMHLLKAPPKLAEQPAGPEEGNSGEADAESETPQGLEEAAASTAEEAAEEAAEE
jgi:hypothetical protein